jgi:hypothetical protein
MLDQETSEKENNSMNAEHQIKVDFSLMKGIGDIKVKDRFLDLSDDDEDTMQVEDII